MAVTDLFAGEIATELLKLLYSISRKSCPCKSSAESLMASVNELLPIIQEIKYSGVELPPNRQFQLDGLSRTLTEGLEISRKVLASNRWNVYKNLQLARKMEKMEKKISTFINGPLQVHILADVHHMRFETTERFDKLDWSAKRLEERIGNLKIGLGGGGGGGVGGWMDEAVKRVEEERKWDGSFGQNFYLGLGIEEGKRKVKEMVFEREIFNVVGICGIGGSGKTTLANEICRDDQVRRHFENRILFLTVSQSPNVEQLRAKILGFITGADGMGGMGNDLVQKWNFQFEWRIGAPALIVLDDVWSLKVLEQLIYKVAGCKTLVVSRFKFPTVFDATYNVELLRGNEAISLFCHSAFGKTSIPPAADSNLVKQIVDECKGLPLALKVIGASLRDQPEMYWASAKKRLSRGEPICESHESKLHDRMAISTQFLSKKVRECFLDLGSFPEDKKIPLDVLINVWVEIHDLDDEEAFAILVELSDKNLLTLVRDARAGDKYSSYYEICVVQHDVLRDLAIHLSSCGDVNECKRLLMPRREAQLPKEWERNADRPFNAQIVSIHTGEMNEMDWFRVDFPKAEVLILNFSANEFFLPPFIDDMPKLRALVMINYSTTNATVAKMEAKWCFLVTMALLVMLVVVVNGDESSQVKTVVKIVKGKKVCDKGWECKGLSAYCCNQTISDFFQTYQFENLFSKRNTPVAHASGFWDYHSFITAAAEYQPHGFGTAGGKLTGQKEVAAFLGHVGSKTSCGYGVATGGPLAWGLCYNKEMSPSKTYCDDYYKYTYPCTPGVSYHGRGALPLYWNYNYGKTGEALKTDLLNHPEYLENNATLAFQAAIWKWMTPEKKHLPSAHDVFVGKWKPTKNDTLAKRVPGFGTTMNVLYGDQVCGKGDDESMNNIVSHYLYYLDLMGVGREEAGSHDVLSCAEQLPFNQASASASSS